MGRGRSHRCGAAGRGPAGGLGRDVPAGRHPCHRLPPPQRGAKFTVCAKIRQEINAWRGGKKKKKRRRRGKKKKKQLERSSSAASSTRRHRIPARAAAERGVGGERRGDRAPEAPPGPAPRTRPAGAAPPPSPPGPSRALRPPLRGPRAANGPVTHLQLHGRARGRAAAAHLFWKAMSSRGSRMFSSGSHVLYLAEGTGAAVRRGPGAVEGSGPLTPGAPGPLRSSRPGFGPAGGGWAGGEGRGGAGGHAGDRTVYLAQLLFRRNSKHVMMKFSKSPFPDPLKRPRRGGGTRPRGPTRGAPSPPPPPPRLCHAAPSAPRPHRPLPPGAAIPVRPAGPRGFILALISPLPTPPPPPLGSAIWSPAPEEGKGEGAIFWCTSAAASLLAPLPPPPARAPPPPPAARPNPAGAPRGRSPRVPRSVLTWATIPSISPGTPLCPAERGRQRHGVQRDPPPARGPLPASPPPSLRTFRIRFFSMLSTAKTCSPTAGSSMLRSGRAEPGVRAARCGRAGLGLRQLPPPNRQTLRGGRGTATHANPGARRQGGGASRARLPVNGGAGGLAQRCRGARRGGGAGAGWRGGHTRAARPPPHA